MGRAPEQARGDEGRGPAKSTLGREGPAAARGVGDERLRRRVLAPRVGLPRVGSGIALGQPLSRRGRRSHRDEERGPGEARAGGARAGEGERGQGKLVLRLVAHDLQGRENSSTVK